MDPAITQALEKIRQALEAERDRAATLDDAISAVLSSWKGVERHGIPDFRLVYNVALYVLVFDRDFSVLKVQMLEAKDRWSQRFVARQMAVSLAELCEDLPALLGKPFREAAARLGVPPSFMAHLDSATKAFNKARRRHEPRLRELRNSIGAHRELDAVKQLSATVGLDPLEVYELAPDFYVALEQFIKAKTALLAYMGRPAVLLKQLFRREEAV